VRLGGGESAASARYKGSGSDRSDEIREQSTRNVTGLTRRATSIERAGEMVARVSGKLRAKQRRGAPAAR
jgi:hypothetical protein